MFRADLFAGKRFLISGGGTGLGRIMLERFVELGADCVICGRRGGVLEETAKEVMAKYPGRRVDTFAVDIRVATAVEEMIERIWATGPLDDWSTTPPGISSPGPRTSARARSTRSPTSSCTARST
jgi:NAD(P)-dependent dehydrogenase (short-subunit alcohol dehydrogenase family)